MQCVNGIKQIKSTLLFKHTRLNMLDNDYSEDLSLFEAEKTPCLAFSN
jgi:hypothetical protein